VTEPGGEREPAWSDTPDSPDTRSEWQRNYDASVARERRSLDEAGVSASGCASCTGEAFVEMGLALIVCLAFTGLIALLRTWSEAALLLVPASVFVGYGTFVLIRGRRAGESIAFTNLKRAALVAAIATVLVLVYLVTLCGCFP